MKRKRIKEGLKETENTHYWHPTSISLVTFFYLLIKQYLSIYLFLFVYPPLSCSLPAFTSAFQTHFLHVNNHCIAIYSLPHKYYLSCFLTFYLIQRGKFLSLLPHLPSLPKASSPPTHPSLPTPEACTPPRALQAN